MNDPLSQQVEMYLAKNPKLVEAMELFGVTQAQYEKALRALQPQVQIIQSDKTVTPLPIEDPAQAVDDDDDEVWQTFLKLLPKYQNFCRWCAQGLSIEEVRKEVELAEEAEWEKTLNSPKGRAILDMLLKQAQEDRERGDVEEGGFGCEEKDTEI